MNTNPEKGSAMEGLLILGALCIVLFVFIIPTGQYGPTQSIFSVGGGQTTYNTSGPSYTQNTSGSSVSRNSSYSKSVSLFSGNASYSYEPYDEYVSISNNSDTPVDITGWWLKNGKGERTYAIGGTLQKFPSDQVSIPRASAFVSPTGSNTLQNVVLKRGEKAIVTTGIVSARSPYTIVSFKENKCSGYLENLPQYQFTPSLEQSCVRPRNEPGVALLDVPCQKYIESMRSCYTPTFDGKDREGNTCHGCVDGNPNLSTSCVAFIKSHFSYPGCLAYHASDPDFSGNTWRIFLNRTWEMWASSHETLYLLDPTGKIVDYTTY